MEYLTSQELLALVQRVFNPADTEKNLALLVDLPADTSSDLPRWVERRQIAFEWYKTLTQAAQNGQTAIQTRLYLYQAVGANNGDLPATMWLFDGDKMPLTAATMSDIPAVATSTVLSDNQLLMAPTQYSATAPLKLAARSYKFKAATLPGFSAAMIPALRLDYSEVARRVLALSKLLTGASGANITFKVKGLQAPLKLFLDLRHRSAHSSTGLIREAGNAGNVPSGESYIVPYEGELAGDPTRTHGTLPVQFGAEVIYYQIENNRAIGVTGTGPTARQESTMLREEPAYGNLAELGLGVLTDFGLSPIGEILLDEKLGLHIAFGRSDHFGGQIGAKDFNNPARMVHIDRVYVRGLQPAISIQSCILEMDDGRTFTLITDDIYNPAAFIN